MQLGSTAEDIVMGSLKRRALDNEGKMKNVRNHLKPFYIAVCVVVATLGLITDAHATSIAPGGTVSVYSDFAAGTFGAVQADTGVQAVTGLDFQNDVTFTGSFRQIVVIDTVTGFLDFLYQLQRSGGPDPIEDITTTSFAGFTTDVGICTLCANLIAPVGPTKYAPGAIDRSGSGSVVGFDFNNQAIDDANMTYLLVIRTNATTWVPGSTQVLDGGVDTVFSYAPGVAVPDAGSTLALLGLGMLSLGYLKRRTT
jgi:hypothetical protein